MDAWIYEWMDRWMDVRILKGVERVPVFVISHVVVNTLIVFKVVPQVYCDWRQVNHIKVFLVSF